MDKENAVTQLTNTINMTNDVLVELKENKEYDKYATILKLHQENIQKLQKCNEWLAGENEKEEQKKKAYDFNLDIGIARRLLLIQQQNPQFEKGFRYDDLKEILKNELIRGDAPKIIYYLEDIQFLLPHGKDLYGILR